VSWPGQTAGPAVTGSTVAGLDATETDAGVAGARAVTALLAAPLGSFVPPVAPAFMLRCGAGGGVQLRYQAGQHAVANPADELAQDCSPLICQPQGEHNGQHRGVQPLLDGRPYRGPAGTAAGSDMPVTTTLAAGTGRELARPCGRASGHRISSRGCSLPSDRCCRCPGTNGTPGSTSAGRCPGRPCRTSTPTPVRCRRMRPAEVPGGPARGRQPRG